MFVFTLFTKDLFVLVHKSMKRVLLVLMIALMMAGTVVAQNGRFGKPSQEEWELTSEDYAPDASAVVL